MAKDNIEEIPEKLEEVEAAESIDDGKDSLQETLKIIKETASEEDPRPSQHLSLRTILGGDLLSTQSVLSQI